MGVCPWTHEGVSLITHTQLSIIMVFLHMLNFYTHGGVPSQIIIHFFFYSSLDPTTSQGYFIYLTLHTVVPKLYMESPHVLINR